MITPLIGKFTSASTAAAQWNWLTNQVATWASSAGSGRYQNIAVSGTLQNFTVHLQTAPGTGTSWDYTIVKNGVDTALTVHIADTNTTATDSTHTVSVSPGDTLGIHAVPTNTPAASGQGSSLAVQLSCASNVSVTMAGTNGAMSNTAVQYQGLQGWNNSLNLSSTESDVSVVMPTAGTFKNMYAWTTAAPTAGKSYTVTFRKNGADQSLTTSISGTNTTNHDTTNSVSVVAGDVVSVSWTPVGTPTAAVPRVSLEFDPTTDGESLMLYGDNNNALVSTAYEIPFGRGQQTWTATESSRQVVSPVAMTVSKLYASIATPLTGSMAYAITLRNNTASTTLTTTLDSTHSTNQDLSHSPSIAAGDIIAIQETPTNSPTLQPIKISMVAYVAPPAAATNQGSTLLLMGVG